MISRIFWLALAFVVCCSSEARITYDLYRKGALAKVRIKVVDQDGVIVPGAKIWGAFTTGSGFNDYALVDGVTDTNGVFVARNRCNGRLRFDVRKEGYYRTEENVRFWDAKKDPTVIDGKWQPYGETRTVVLKKIKAPIPIGQLGRCSITVPVYDKWIGFDIGKRSWVPPYGNGTYSDVMLKFGHVLVHRQTDFKMTMDVSFTNNPYAGCYQMKDDGFSERRTIYHADATQNFSSTLNYVHERHPGSQRIDNRLENDSYLVFRTRTKVDANGRLISAHYGIIQGKWAFFDTMLSGGYLFNPTPNDTNLEDAETARLSRLGYKQSLEFEKARKR